MLLVCAVEKSTNVTVLAKDAAGAPHGTAIHCHFHLLVKAGRPQARKSAAAKGLALGNRCGR
jgi:hypothetical protein